MCPVLPLTCGLEVQVVTGGVRSWIQVARYEFALKDDWAQP